MSAQIDLQVPLQEHEPVRKDRLTVKTCVYHRHVGENPFRIQDGRDGLIYTRELQSTEQLYQRRITLTCAWHKFEAAWLQEIGCSLLIVENQEGKIPMFTKPNEAEKKRMASRVIELRFGTAIFVIPPREHFQGCPDNLSDIHLRSRGDDARACVYVVPA